METKDIATVALSALALCVSLAAFQVSYTRGRREQLRAIRQQLAETTDKIAESQLEHTKLMFGDAKADVALQRSVSGIVSQRMSALLNQAVYLTTQAPSLVSAVDYGTIASVSASTGDLALAETNYRKAIAACPTDFARSGMTRSYGNFLFSQRRFEEGRATCRNAVTLITGNDNMARAQKGSIYMNWAWCERNHANAPNQAADAFENASAEFTGIDNEGMRQPMLARLEHDRRLPMHLTPPPWRRPESPPSPWPPAMPPNGASTSR